MKTRIIRQNSLLNNSFLTVEMWGNTGAVDTATKIAAANGCTFSHNLTIKPLTTKQFGTLNFFMGDHNRALAQLLDTL